jgi:hypothetical protein
MAETAAAEVDPTQMASASSTNTST